jgi:hypothetical protein
MIYAKISEDPRWKPLLEKFDAFRISFNEKWQNNKNALVNSDHEVIEYSYNEIKDAWDSMASTQKEIDEFQKEY